MINYGVIGFSLHLFSISLLLIEISAKGFNILYVFLAVVLYYLYLSLTGNVIHKQRLIYSYCRNFLIDNYGFSRLKEIEIDDWIRFNGFRTLSICYFIVAIVLSTSILLEGRFMHAFHIIEYAFYLWLSFQTETEFYAKLNAQFLLCSQIVTLLTFGSNFTESGVRRMAITRFIFTFSFFERIDEMFMQLVIFPTWYSYYRGFSYQIILLPTILFCTCVIPIEFFGIRLFILRKLSTVSQYVVSSRVAAIVCFLPVFVILFSYGGNINYGMIHTVFPVILVLLLITSVYTSKYSDEFESYYNPTYVNTTCSSVLYSENTYFNHVIIMSCLVLIMFGPYTIQCIILMSLLLLEKAKEEEQDKKEIKQKNLLEIYFKMFKKRRILFIVYSLIIYSTSIGNDDMVMILLNTSRIFFTFDDEKLISHIISKSSFECALQLFFASPSARLPILSIFCYSIVCAMAGKVSKENHLKLINQVKNADSFLDHAVKQKFSAIGAALEHILEDEQVLEKMNIESINMLSKSKWECIQGVNSCYLSSVAMKYEYYINQDIFFKTKIDLVHYLQFIFVGLFQSNQQHVYDSGHATNPNHQIQGEIGKFYVKINLDLFKALIVNLILTNQEENSSQCSIKVIATEKHTIQIQFQPTTIIGTVLFHSNNSAFKNTAFSPIRNHVAQLIGCKILDSGKIVEFPKEEEVDDIRHYNKNLSEMVLLVSEEDDLPKKLVLEEEQQQQQRDEDDNLKNSKIDEELVLEEADVFHSSPPGASTTPFRIRQRRLTTKTIVEGTNSIHDHHHQHKQQQQKRITPDWDVGKLQHSSNTPPGGFHLKDCIIAILDDNALVRKNLTLTLKNYIICSNESFVTGRTYSEAIFFPIEISIKNCDIAIFDENLEYEEESILAGGTIKGTILASKAKQNGFKGCLILHSANANLRHDLDDTVFHGFIEKTSSRENFIEGVIKSYEKFLSRKEE